MKKILACSIALLAMAATPVFAATGFTQATNGQVQLGKQAGNQTNVPVSTNVQLDYIGDTVGPGLGYILAASHSSGTRTYASSSGDTAVYYTGTSMDTTDVPTTAPTGTASAGFDLTKWTKQ